MTDRSVAPARNRKGSHAGPIVLDDTTAIAWLHDQELVPRATTPSVTPLSGGISNIVLAIAWDGGRLVLKQSLPRLRVAADWEFDRARLMVEARCMSYLGGFVPSGAVPEVVAVSERDFLLAMTHAPPGGRQWKESLMRGAVDLATADRAGTLLGAIHGHSAGDPVAGEQFDDLMPLHQGRIDPYYRTVAEVNPELAPAINAEIERQLATRSALVLGDFAPKNMIAYPDHLLIVDFETAHFGDPSFDVAFLLTHLLLKSLMQRDARADLLRAAHTFHQAYLRAAGPAAAPASATVSQLGCLLLSRVDGKSPVEYLRGEGAKARARALARELLLNRGHGVDGAIELSEEVFAG
jgi:5-methylthioribose kinase